MVDVRGKELRMGQTIVYPVRRGSVMELKVATVAEVSDEGLTCFTAGKGRRIVIKRADRTAIVE